MTKSTMSKNFARFAKTTTSGKFDEVRKAERTARGSAATIGDKGTAVFEIVCGEKAYKDDPDETYPLVEVVLTIQTPEEKKGKELKDVLNLTWYIKDSEKPGSDWTAEDAWGSMLQDLERLGVPNEITSGYEDFQEVLDWVEAEPRLVDWEVIADTDSNGNPTFYRGRPNQRVVAYSHIEESATPSADAKEEFSFPEGTRFVSYRGVKYGVLEEKDDDMVLIKNCQTGSERTVLAASVKQA